MRSAPRNLLTINDLSNEDLAFLVARGTEFSRGGGRRATPKTLDGAVVGVYFRETSTRTRTAFSSGALRLGGSVLAFGPSDLQVNTGESIADTGHVLAGMLDILVVRTAGTATELRLLGSHERMPVINAMSSEEHPTQALADLTTIASKLGGIEGTKMLYVGEGNNTAAALALALSRFRGVELYLRTPAGYGLAEEVSAQARKQAADNSSVVDEQHTMTDLPGKMDIIYTTRWQTTGTSKANPRWRDAFQPFRVSQDLWTASPDAIFMHDLPAHRGDEVTAEVLDGPASVAFEQAWNKMYSAMAVLEWSWGS